MNSTRLTTAAAISGVMALASVTVAFAWDEIRDPNVASMPAAVLAAAGAVDKGFDMREYEPVLFSGGSSNAFFDGTESGGVETALGFDMRDYEPVLFSGGNSNAFFDGTESGGVDRIETAGR